MRRLTRRQRAVSALLATQKRVAGDSDWLMEHIKKNKLEKVAAKMGVLPTHSNNGHSLGRTSPLGNPLLAVPPEVAQKIQQWRAHRGALTRLAQMVGVEKTYFSRVARGKARYMDQAVLDRTVNAMQGFNPGPKTGARRTRRSNGREEDVIVAEAPRVDSFAYLRGLVEGAAIQAEISRRTVFEFLDGPHSQGATHG